MFEAKQLNHFQLGIHNDIFEHPMVIKLGDIFWQDALHSRDPGIKTLTEFVDIFQHLQNGQIGFVRVWGGKSTRDKTFLSLPPLLGPNQHLACEGPL